MFGNERHKKTIVKEQREESLGDWLASLKGYFTLNRHLVDSSFLCLGPVCDKTEWLLFRNVII